MSATILTGFVFGNPGTQLFLLSGGSIFIDIFCEENSINLIDNVAPPAFKIRRFGPLARVPDGPLWASEEASFEVPPYVRSLSLAVSVDSPVFGNILVGRAELDTNYLLILSQRTHNVFFEPLAANSHDAQLIISSTCMHVPSVEELSTNGIPSYMLTHNQLVLPSQRDAGYRFRKIGDHFLQRSLHSRLQADIDKAIFYLEQAVGFTPDGQVDKPACLNNLGNMFMGRFQNSGDPISIDKAISQYQYAVYLTPDGHSDKPGRLSNLGSSLLRRFDYSGDLTDVEEAISHHEHTLRLIPDGHPDKSGCLNNIGNSLTRRFERLRDTMDIDNAISHTEHALRLTPDGHPDRPTRLTNLGNSFLRRFWHLGDQMDIKKAISYHEQALHLTPDGHPDKPSFFNKLGNSLMGHSEHSGDLMDIKKAISHYEHAVSFIPDGHADKPGFLQSLGISLARAFEFEHSGHDRDIGKTPSHHEGLASYSRAIKPGHPADLDNSLARPFEHSTNLINIDKVISYHERALDLTPDGHANKPSCLHNLGNSFVRRFDYSRDLTDIDRAISHHERALHLIPDGHADKLACLISLGNSSIRRFQDAGDATDLQRAIFSFEACAKSSIGRPSSKLEAAITWARLSSDNPSASLSGYETAISLLPRVAWLGQSLSDRYERLASIGSIATEAAAAAIASDRLDIALEWLEQARSIVWGQLLSLRTPVDDLRMVNPSLAEDLVLTARALENTSTRDTTGNGGKFEKSDVTLSLEAAAQNHRRLAEKWDNLLLGARMLPGFENFLLPKKLSALSKAAESGPIAVINVHESRSDALILLSGLEDVFHIPLDNLYDKALGLQRSLDNELRAAGIGVRDVRAGRLAPPKLGDQGFSKILASLWTDVVQPVLDGLAFTTSITSSDLPRIWWCPTGPLTFLPIHAAGLYDQSPSGSNIFDFAVSSYTPTITALLEASREVPMTYKGLLGVSQRSTPGLKELPSADKELDLIKLLDSKLNMRSIEGKLATVERVLESMEDSSWVHFACHAVQDASSPIQSAFCLDNGHLTLSKIITKSFPNADFAFLSACETATGDEKLPEEAVHLAAGMLSAGYRSVIATMWSIGDNDAPLIASEVYPRLVSGSAPDSTLAAYALHHAVKRLRTKLGTGSSRAFLGWVPFIHVGK